MLSNVIHKILLKMEQISCIFFMFINILVSLSGLLRWFGLLFGKEEMILIFKKLFLILKNTFINGGKIYIQDISKTTNSLLKMLEFSILMLMLNCPSLVIFISSQLLLFNLVQGLFISLLNHFSLVFYTYNICIRKVSTINNCIIKHIHLVSFLIGLVLF